MIFHLAGLVGLVAATVMASTDQIILDSAPDNLGDNFVRPAGNLPRLADLLTLESRASIFYSYARDTSMSALFTQIVSGEGQGTTVFVPTNKAVRALARKPHEDPEGSHVGMMGPGHEATSKHNVQRWVGAHIIPVPDVNFTTSTPYNTLTLGATISFTPINSQDRYPADGPVDTDAKHFASVKGDTGAPANINADSARMASKVCVRAGGSALRNRKPSPPVLDTDAAHFATIKGPVSSHHDATHVSNLKESPSLMQKPIWKEYLLNDGVRIILEKQASNGVMYLIDGTVLV